MNIQRNRRYHRNTFPRNVKAIEGDRRIDDDGLLHSPAATCTSIGGQMLHDRTTSADGTKDEILFQEIEQALLSLCDKVAVDVARGQKTTRRSWCNSRMIKRPCHHPTCSYS